jgi:hypothetical protein
MLCKSHREGPHKGRWRDLTEFARTNKGRTREMRVKNQLTNRHARPVHHRAETARSRRPSGPTQRRTIAAASCSRRSRGLAGAGV